MMSLSSSLLCVGERHPIELGEGAQVAGEPRDASLLASALAPSFDDESARFNIDRMPFGLLLLAAVHLVHVVLFLTPDAPGASSAEARWRLSIGAAHAVMLPLALLGALVGRRLRASPERWRLAPVLAAGVYLAFSALVAGFDQLAAPTPTAFVIGAIGLAAFFRYRLVESLAVFAVGVGVALVCAELWQADDALRRSIQVNCVTVAAIAVLIARVSARLHRQIWWDRQLILKQVRTDPLTGILTRGAFLDELRRAATRGAPAALALIDIDDLKAINDRFGHAAGDRAIIAVSDAVRGSIRARDALGRLGGDELCAFLYDADADAAAAVAERMRAACEGSGSPVSIGIALARPGEQVDRLLARADAAMYRAKRGGRNRVGGTEPASS